MTSSATGTDEKRKEALHKEFERLGLRGYWQLRSEQDRPEPRLWRWKDLYPMLMEAGEVIKLGPEAFRRNISMQTGAHVFSMGFQVVMPGETAATHRHTATALRFVVKGGGAFTTSNGEKMVMEPGDLLIQPNYTWHDHTNDTDEPMIWIDELDGGLVNFLEANFREDWAEDALQPITKPDGYSRRMLGAVRQQGVAQEDSAVPFNYKWNETLQTLEQMAAAGETDPYDGVLLEYTNPVTGGSTFKTMTCYVQMLRPGEETRLHRHTGTTLYHSIQGTGVTSVDKTDAVDLSWEEKDCFIVPSWRWHKHRNGSKTEPAYLFSSSDRPILEAAGLHREEAG